MQDAGHGGIARRRTRRVRVGAVAVGGGAPVSVQSMTKTHTTDVAATAAQVEELARAGCHIVRCAVPDAAAADALGEIRRRVAVPIVADVHFDHRLAIRALERGADCVRINPGNIRQAEKLGEVARALRDTGRSVRIGINSGSIRPRGRRTPPGPPGLSELMVEEALKACEVFEKHGVEQIKVSLKASEVAVTLSANRAFAARTDYPLHLGVTAAGPLRRALVKSAVGIGALLAEGIGDTIRVSLTGPPVEEVRIGHEILRALGLEPARPNLVSCPTCGRCRVDLVRVVAEVEKALEGREVPLSIAVMGCEVNGPGEAAEADVGLAAGRGAALLFAQGRPLRKVPEGQMVAALLETIDELLAGRRNSHPDPDASPTSP